MRIHSVHEYQMADRTTPVADIANIPVIFDGNRTPMRESFDVYACRGTCQRASFRDTLDAVLTNNLVILGQWEAKFGSVQCCRFMHHATINDLCVRA